MNAQRTRITLMTVALCAALPACTPDACLWLLGVEPSDDEWDDDEWDEDWRAEDTDDPPTLDVDVSTTDGILGPTDTIRVSVDDDDTIELDVFFDFARSVNRNVERGGTTSVTGADLGEGYGDVLIEVQDADGGFASASVDGLLIDLSAPEIEVEPCVLAASGKGERGTLSAWVGDMWALGRVTVEIVPDGNPDDVLVLGDIFNEWPSTFGDSWDWSYFSVSATELPVGRSTATYLVEDRAGNTTTTTCELFVDAQPPVVSLSARYEDGFVHADVSAADDDDVLPTGLALHAGGAEVAQGQAPSTSFVLDAADFPSGELMLEARARDRAGNEGRSQVLSLALP